MPFYSKRKQGIIKGWKCRKLRQETLEQQNLPIKVELESVPEDEWDPGNISVNGTMPAHSKRKQAGIKAWKNRKLRQETLEHQILPIEVELECVLEEELDLGNISVNDSKKLSGESEEAPVSGVSEEPPVSGESEEPPVSGTPTAGDDCFVPFEVILKQEAGDCFEPEEVELIPMKTAAPVAPDNSSCTFCLEIFAENIARKKQRPKIEHVLSTTLRSPGKVACCPSCWKTFELFYDWKKSCLRSLLQLYKSVRKTSNRTKRSLRLSKIKKDRYQPPSSTQVTPEEHSLSDQLLLLSTDVKAENIERHLNPSSLGEESEQQPTSGNDPLVHATTSQEHFNFNFFEQLQSAGSSTTPELQTATPDFIHPDERKDADWCQEPAMEELPSESLEKTNIECIKCNRQFRQWRTALHHISRCPGSTGTDTSNTQTNSEGDQQQSTAEEDSELVCKTCNMRFPTLKRAQFHIEKCHDNSTVTILQCPQCPRKFVKQDSYEYHMNKHNGIRPYVCQVDGCAKTFYNNKTLLDHKRETHQKQFICDICGTTLGYRSYHSHMLRHERRYACGVCGKRFTAIDRLKKHSTVHTGERNFECKVCGKRFKSREANRVHQRIHTQEKPYECGLCNMRFTYNCSLKAHMEKGHE